MTRDHAAVARECLVAESRELAAIATELAKPYGDTNHADIGKHAARGKSHVKRAEVHALLAIADNLADIAGSLDRP